MPYGKMQNEGQKSKRTSWRSNRFRICFLVTRLICGFRFQIYHWNFHVMFWFHMGVMHKITRNKVSNLWTFLASQTRDEALGNVWGIARASSLMYLDQCKINLLLYKEICLIYVSGELQFLGGMAKKIWGDSMSVRLVLKMNHSIFAQNRLRQECLDKQSACSSAMIATLLTETWVDHRAITPLPSKVSVPPNLLSTNAADLSLLGF